MIKFTVLCLLFILMLGFSSRMTAKIEEPSYTVIKKEESIEIRQYGLMTIIKTELNTSMNNGFRTLAGYIFGGNADQQKIAMTAPVLTGEFDPKKNNMLFVLPASIALEDAPAPLSKEVSVESLQLKQIATIRFSGYANEKSINKHSKMLKNWLNNEKLRYNPIVYVAQYNSPWTLGPFRRNEIWIQLD